MITNLTKALLEQERKRIFSASYNLIVINKKSLLTNEEREKILKAIELIGEAEQILSDLIK